MKKKCLIILFIATLVISLTACASSSEKRAMAKEYNIEEFGKMLKDTDELFQTESEYLTDDELYTTKGYELYEKCSKETGLPFHKKIVLRGKKAASIQGFELQSADQEYNVPCFFEENMINTSLFIKDGENMIVEGIFSEREDSYGCLTNVKIISPSDINKTYANNIDELLSSFDDLSVSSVVMGEVELIQSLADFENAMSLMNIENYEPKDFYYDTVVTLKGEEHSVTFMYDKDKFKELKIGDEIATQGYIDELQSIKMADGSIDVFWGFMGNVYDINILE